MDTTTITEELLGLCVELRGIENQIGALIERSNEQDFVPDPDGGPEWLPISKNRDKRWNEMDMAWSKIHDALELISRAHDLSRKVDSE